MIDRKKIDAMPDEEKREFLSWLEDLVKYVKIRLGIYHPSEDDIEATAEESVPSDPVGDVIIMDHKKKQELAGRRKSGWTSIGFGKVDDRHV
jgi:hypothetical protein